MLTREEAFREARQLAGQGWDLVPCDDTRRGLLGFVALRGEDENQLIQWALFEQPLEPEESVVETASELQDFTSSGDLSTCDDVQRLLLGFVRYEPKRGKAVVRQIRMTRLKQADVEVRKTIMAFRELLKKEEETLLQQRLREVTTCPP